MSAAADRRDRQLASMVESLYDAVLFPARWPRFLQLVTRTYGATVADFTHFDMDALHHTVCVSEGLDAGEIRRYEAHYSSCNVWANSGHVKASSRVVVGEELCSQADLEGSEYYNDFLRPAGVAHVMGAGVRGDERRFTALSVLRSKRRGAFDRAEVLLFQHLAAHLKRAVQLHGRTASRRGSGGPLTALADRLSEGLILLDGAGRTVFVSRAAREILARTPELRLTADGLGAKTAALDAQSRRLVKSALTPPRLGIDTAGGIFRVPNGGSEIVALVAPAGRGEAWLGREGQVVAIWLREPETAPSRTDWLRRAFGVSAAEERLLALLERGLDLEGSAEALGVSRHTVHAQLNAALRKTGTHSQSELRRLLRATRHA
jgi:DNA-binding CsgD family transcriptional regulator/PAS domain-containing protein